MKNMLFRFIIAISLCFSGYLNAMSKPPISEGDTKIRLLFVYNDKVRSDWDDDAGVRTRINEWVEYSNRVMQNSELGIRFEVAHIEKRYFSPRMDMYRVLDEFQRNIGNFTGIEGLRDKYKADYAVVMHDIAVDKCGLGYQDRYARNAYSLVFSKSFNWSTFTQCDDNTLPHEIGHNSGLGHGNLQGRPGLVSYAGGHGKSNGVGGGWSTIMMYPSAIGVFASRVDQFSDPTRKCKGSPCGVPEGQKNPADAVRYFNEVKDIISNYRQ